MPENAFNLSPVPTVCRTFPRENGPAVSARLYLPRQGCASIVYAHVSGADEAACAAALLPTQSALCALSGEAWEADLSPWRAPRAFRKGKDFTGGANAYLAFLCNTVLPDIEAVLPRPGAPRALAGYSLAGLFAVYAAYRCKAFSVLASMSGSLWYDDFAAFCAEQTPARIPFGVYFSLGRREPHTRDARMARVDVCTETVRLRLDALGAKTTFVSEEGGHFQGIEARCAHGVSAAAALLAQCAPGQG